MVRKILVYAPFYPPHVGGLENFASELHEQLTSLPEYTLVVFTPQLPKNAARLETEDTIQIKRFPATEIIPNFPIPNFWQATWWRLWYEVWQSHPDIIISHTRFFIPTLMAGLHSIFLRIPWIHVEHGSSAVQVASPLTTWLAKIYDLTVGRWVLCSATEIVCISQAVQHFVARFINRPTHLIYRGLKMVELSDIPAATIDQSKILIVTAARLYHWKGLMYAIQAIQQLSPDLQDKIIYYIIGNGEDRAYLTQIAKAPVVLKGELSHTETISFLKAADIYIHASLPGGGLATSLLEAMYCHCAVIATPHEGAAEVIYNQQTGLVVPSENPTAIAQAIEQLQAQPNLRLRLGQEAHEYVRQHFNWQHSVSQFDQLCRKLLHQI